MIWDSKAFKAQFSKQSFLGLTFILRSFLDWLMKYRLDQIALAPAGRIPYTFI